LLGGRLLNDKRLSAHCVVHDSMCLFIVALLAAEAYDDNDHQDHGDAAYTDTHNNPCADATAWVVWLARSEWVIAHR